MSEVTERVVWRKQAGERGSCQCLPGCRGSSVVAIQGSPVAQVGWLALG
jgi:hypothetical protein